MDRVAARAATHRGVAAAVGVRVRPVHARRHGQILRLRLFRQIDHGYTGQVQRYGDGGGEDGARQLAMRRSHRRLPRLSCDQRGEGCRRRRRRRRRRLGLLYLDIDIYVDLLVEIVAGQRGGRDLRSRYVTGRVQPLGAALVVHQVMPPSESHLAMLALERFLPLVDQEMSLQLVRVAEFRGAKLARVRPFAGMDAQMAAQVGNLDELPVAMAAVIRLLARVQPHVGLEVVVPCESVIFKQRGFCFIHWIQFHRCGEIELNFRSFVKNQNLLFRFANEILGRCCALSVLHKVDIIR